MFVAFPNVKSVTEGEFIWPDRVRTFTTNIYGFMLSSSVQSERCECSFKLTVEVHFAAKIKLPRPRNRHRLGRTFCGRREWQRTCDVSGTWLAPRRPRMPRCRPAARRPARSGTGQCSYEPPRGPSWPPAASPRSALSRRSPSTLHITDTLTSVT